MSTEYVKTNWQDGDIITADKMNNIENGIERLDADTSQLKEDLGDISENVTVTTEVASKVAGSSSLPEGFSTTSGYLRGMAVSNPGNLSGTSSTTNNVFWMQAVEDMDVYVDIPNVGSNAIGIFETQPYGESYRKTPIYSSNNESYPLPTKESPLHATAGQYISFSYYNGATLENSAWTLYQVTDGDNALKSTIGLTNTMSSEVDAKISEAENNILDDGYMQLPVSDFARNAWTSYIATDSRNYRVRCTKTINFNHDVYVVMDDGFYVNGYYSDGTSVGEQITCFKLTKNTPVHLYIRRITEDSSEVANISEFASALKISTLLAQIEKDGDTFTDVSMFERVGIGGDSYAAGGGIISGISSLTWGKNLERQAGIMVDLYAKSGQDVVQWVTDSTSGKGLPSLLAGTECGLYWLAHGINGTGTAEALGTASDMSASPHPQTFYGQYVEAIEQIKTTFPKARIVLATVTGSSYGLYETVYQNVNTAIRAIAEYCGVPVVDLADDHFYKSPWYKNGMRSNHPTAMICAGMAMANRRLISKCIQNNPDFFITYGSADDDPYGSD